MTWGFKGGLAKASFSVKDADGRLIIIVGKPTSGKGQLPIIFDRLEENGGKRYATHQTRRCNFKTHR